MYIHLSVPSSNHQESVDWFKEHNHDLLLFVRKIDFLKLDFEYLANWDRLTNDEIVSVPFVHKLVSSFKDGNFWVLKEHEAGFGEHKGVVSRLVLISFLGIEEHGQHERDVLGFNVFTSGFAVLSFLNETIPWRQRGQGIEPGGPFGLVVVLLVEHRYNAHRVHNSCKQPVK